MAGEPAYPFEPKSNAHLKPGQFWGVPLTDGRWACGRVLATKIESDDYFVGNARTFLAALMDWVGEVPRARRASLGIRSSLKAGRTSRPSMRMAGPSSANARCTRMTSGACAKSRTVVAGPSCCTRGRLPSGQRRRQRPPHCRSSRHGESASCLCLRSGCSCSGFRWLRTAEKRRFFAVPLRPRLDDQRRHRPGMRTTGCSSLSRMNNRSWQLIVFLRRQPTLRSAPPPSGWKRATSSPRMRARMRRPSSTKAS